MSKNVLLDECTDEELAKLIKGHEVKHVRAVGLDGVKDDRLLNKASEKGFNVFLTSEKKFYQHIGDEKRYALGIVVLRLPDGVEPRLKNLIPLVPTAIKAIEQVKAGEMLLVHPSGQIEKVTHAELVKQEKLKKEQQRQRAEDKKTELAEWQEQRPQGVTPKEWAQEFGKKKQQEYRENIAKQGQQI